MRRFLQLFFLLIYLIALLIPGYTFFSLNTDIFRQKDVSVLLLTFFRLAGLYAFTLVWSQVMLGALREPLTKLYGGKILKLHITLGIFTLLFATLHPLLFYVGYLIGKPPISPIQALPHYFGNTPLLWYGYLGPVAWTIMLCTVITAKLRTKPYLQKHWRTIHYFNYLVFLFAFVHSFNVGSEVHAQPLQNLYYFFAISYGIAIAYKWGYKRLLKRKTITASQPLPNQ